MLEVALHCRDGRGSLFGHHSAESSLHHSPMDTHQQQQLLSQLREQLRGNIMDTVTRALRERDQTCRQSPNCRSENRQRQSRFNEYFSEYYGGESDYYDDDYEDSYSDYSPSDWSRSQSVASLPDEHANPNAPKPETSDQKGATADTDPIIHSKSSDVLLAKYAACGPREEPDPTTQPILDSLAAQLKTWFHGYVAQSEIKRLQENNQVTL